MLRRSEKYFLVIGGCTSVLPLKAIQSHRFFTQLESFPVINTVYRQSARKLLFMSSPFQPKNVSVLRPVSSLLGDRGTIYPRLLRSFVPVGTEPIDRKYATAHIDWWLVVF